MSHRPNKRCPVPYCGLETSNERILFDHYKYDHMVNVFACAECFQGFNEIADLSSHFGEVHPSLVEFRFISTEVKCGSKSYQGYEVLSEEKVLPKGKRARNDDPFQCFLCTDSFQAVEVFQTHCVLSHSGKFLTCSRCQTPFPSKMRLIEHSRNCQVTTAQNPLDAVPLVRADKCLLCKGVNINKAEALQHYMETHLNTRYVCENCQKDFLSDAQLIEHTELIHSPIKPMKTRAVTATAIQAKFNERVCAFAECSMQHFKTIDEIRDHFLSAHKDCKILQCDKCDECYLSSRLLKDHRKLHSDKNGSKEGSAPVKKEAKIKAEPKKRTKSPVTENVPCDNSQKMQFQSPQPAEHHGVVDLNKSSIQVSPRENATSVDACNEHGNNRQKYRSHKFSHTSKAKHSDEHASSESKSKRHSKLLEMIARKLQRTETETLSGKCHSIFETNVAASLQATKTETSPTEIYTNAVHTESNIFENGNDSAMVATACHGREEDIFTVTEVASASSDPSTGDINGSTGQLNEGGYSSTMSPPPCSTAPGMPNVNINLERVIGDSPQPKRTLPPSSDFVDLTLDSDEENAKDEHSDEEWELFFSHYVDIKPIMKTENMDQ